MGVKLNAINVTHGTVNGSNIVVDMSRVEHAAPVRVRLTAAYSIVHPPGGLTRPSFTGAAAPSLEYPRTLASGTVISLHAGEAAALIAAGAAVSA